MRVEIRDREAFSALTLVSLRAYLNSKGWVDEGEWGGRATIFSTVDDNRKWEILCPHRDTVADFAERMAENVAILATVEDRSQLDVLHDLSSTGADVIHVRSLNGLAKEALSLRQNTEWLGAAYNMLASAARAAEKPSAAFRGRASDTVTAYLDDVQPLPGFHEGYALTLRSPVPAGFGTPMGFGDAFAAPFPRRATSQLARALDHTAIAIAESVSENSLEPFRQGVSEGVSANLCDSVATLASEGKGIKIDLHWSGVRPSNLADGDFRFTENSAAILSEAAEYLRRKDPSFDEHIIAQVVRLEREPDEFDGKAIILSMRDQHLVRLWVKFEEPVYDMVIQAFKEQEFISLSGDVIPVGRGYELRRPHNLSLLVDNS